jgi:type I restriction enzyme S subunit
MTDGNWIESKDQDPTGGVRLIQLADIGDGQFLNRSSRFLNDATASRLRCTFLKPGDVLIARMPDPLGRACVFPGAEMPAVAAVDVCIWRPGRHAADPRWLMHIINSPPVRGELSNLASGTTRQRVSGGNLKRFSLPVPPLAEQRRIVARIEALFARIRQARADLLRIAPLAQKYRDAETDRAFRADEATGWTMTTAGDLAEIKSGITLGKRHPEGAELVERPYLRVANVQRGRLKLDDVKTIAVSPSDARKLELREGDVLMNEGGDRDKLGRGWVWEGQIPGCIHQNHVFRLRLRDDRITPRYLSRYANHVGAAYFLQEGKQTTNLASISMTKVAALPVPVPPPQVAIEIDRALDGVEAKAASLTHEATRALALLNHLERSILTRAFRGELVPQDPADEPASVSLARSQEGAPAAPRRGRPRRAA